MSSSTPPRTVGPRLTLPDTQLLSASALASSVMTLDGRPILLCDMDGVIAQWIRGVYRLAGQRAAELGVEHPLAEVQLSWEMMTGDPVADGIIRWAMDHADLYSSLDPEEGAVQALQVIQDEIAEVFFASTAYVTNPMAHSAKAAWCHQHYGDGWASKLILAEDKTALRGVVLIDDKPTVAGRMAPLWERIVFDREYNRHVPGTRIHDWTDPATLDVIAATIEARMHALAAG